MNGFDGEVIPDAFSEEPVVGYRHWMLDGKTQRLARERLLSMDRDSLVAFMANVNRVDFAHLTYEAWVPAVGPLRALNGNHLWMPGENEARCLAVYGILGGRDTYLPTKRYHGEIAPDPGCTCGFYARKEATGTSSRGSVEGEVEMWGRVVVGTLGYRAQHARITKLYDYGSEWADVLSRVAHYYGVPLVSRPPAYTLIVNDNQYRRRLERSALRIAQYLQFQMTQAGTGPIMPPGFGAS